MSKESKFQSDLDERIDRLRKRGITEERINLLRTSLSVQAQAAPFEAILQWLDEQLSSFSSHAGLRGKKSKKL